MTAALTSEGIAAGVRNESTVVATLTLAQSDDGMAPWTEVPGLLGQGYTMSLDPLHEFHYLDVTGLTASPLLDDSQYPFYLDAWNVPEGFFEYWAARGVVDGASEWQGIMWEIINGREPIFYLEVSAGGTEFSLVDGLQFLASGGSLTDPLRVSGDYPLGTYSFGGEIKAGSGTVEDYINVQITFTYPVTVSILPNDEIIDGSGYVDVFIHMSNVRNLYALDIELSFDPAVLEVVDLLTNEGQYPGVNLEPIGGLFEAGFWAENSADNVTGTIKYAATQLRPTDPANGEGSVAMIRFQAKSAGVSDIEIVSVDLSDRDGYLIGLPLTFEHGTITVRIRNMYYFPLFYR